MKKGLTVCAAMLLLAACSKTEPPSKESTSTTAQTPTVEAKAPEPPKKPKNKGPWEGPFGVKMGLTVDELRSAVELTEGQGQFIWKSSSAPSPHDAFESYFYTITDDVGLCKIAAFGKTINTSGFGTELKSEYTTLQSALIERYGNPSSKFDFLANGSIWTESKYWMMGLLKKDRVLNTFWIANPDSKSTKKVDLPNDLESIMLEAVAEGSDAGFVNIRYAFKNEDACMDTIKKNRNKSL